MREPKFLRKFVLTTEMELLEKAAQAAIGKGEIAYTEAAESYNSLLMATFGEDAAGLKMVSYERLPAIFKK